MARRAGIVRDEIEAVKECSVWKATPRPRGVAFSRLEQLRRAGALLLWQVHSAARRPLRLWPAPVHPALRDVDA